MRTLTLLSALAITLVSCAYDDPERDSRDAGTDMTDMDLRNMNTPMPGVITAGQISPEQLQELGRRGVRDVITLRRSEEDDTGWEEARAAQLGIRFVRIPVNGADGLTRENAQALDDALRGSEGRDTVVYCGSSNRVGGLFACRARWIEGKSKEEALATGTASGATFYVDHIVRILEIQ